MIGEWRTVHDDDDLGPAVTRKLVHDIGHTSAVGSSLPILPVPCDGVRIRENSDGSIDIEADVWVQGLQFDPETLGLPIRHHPYRGLLKEATR